MKPGSRLILIALLGLPVAGCANGGIPAIGLTACNTGGLALGGVGGALAGGLIGRNWQSAAIGGAVGGTLGFLTTKVFAHQLACDDQQRLTSDTKLAAAAPTGRRISYNQAVANDGSKVSGYVMPVSNWYTDPEGKRVRDVKQVLTDGHDTQTSTIQVAATDVPNAQTGPASSSSRGVGASGYVEPK